MDGEGSEIVGYVVGGAALILGVAVLAQLVHWLRGSGERAIDAQVRDAFRAGDFRRAGDLQAGRNRFAEAARLYAQGKEWSRQGRALEKLGEREAAAEAYMRGNDFAIAATLFEAVGDSARAAVCLQQSASSPQSQRSAAEHFARSGNHGEAGRLYQAVGDFQRAADAYAKVRDLDPPDLVATMLENAALVTPDGDPNRKVLLARVADVAYKLGQHERAARAYDGAGQARHAAELYERALRRFDLAAALYAEAGDAPAAARLTAQAGGEVAVLRARETRARERGEAELARRLRDEIRAKEPKHPSIPRSREDETPTLASPLVPAAAKRPATEPGARYELVSELGRGGMGIVHRAKDLLLGRDVALKFMPAEEADGPLQQLFRREARAAAALSHPGIVTIFDIGRQDGREFIAMELIDGVPLDRLLTDRGGKLSLLEGLEVAEAALAALAYAHDHRVIHRDLKPANLMKLRNGGIKVMDFGLAKQMGHSTGGNHPTFIAGTPAYMPPEQLMGAADARSDLFAIGATLYELFTGLLPGHDHEPASSARNYPTPRQREPLVPERLSSLIMRCLAQDPTQRPQSAGEVLAEVQAVKQSILDAFRSLGDEPVRETPSRPVELAKVEPIKLDAARALAADATRADPARPSRDPAPQRPGAKPATEVVQESRLLPGRPFDPRSADTPPAPVERRPRGPGVHVNKSGGPEPEVLGGKRPKT